jgi:opacity protein-like surface antigen
MKNSTRTIGKVCFCVFVLVASTLAQSRLQPDPPAAATGPAYYMSVGYTNVTMSIPGAGRTNLNGLTASGNVDFNPLWGVALESNYARTPSILGTPHSGYVLSFLGGPVFYPLERGNTRVFVHALAGSGLVDGAAPISDTNYRYGWRGAFSYAVGGGAEHSVSGPFSVRVGADYLHTAFFDYNAAVLPQNNFRVMVSAVFHLNEHRYKGSVR